MGYDKNNVNVNTLRKKKREDIFIQQTVNDVLFDLSIF
jgi:hypothetical protein